MRVALLGEPSEYEERDAKENDFDAKKMQYMEVVEKVTQAVKDGQLSKREAKEKLIRLRQKMFRSVVISEHGNPFTTGAILTFSQSVSVRTIIDSPNSASKMPTPISASLPRTNESYTDRSASLNTAPPLFSAWLSRILVERIVAVPW